MVVADPRLEVVDLKSEVPERRSGGIRPNLTPERDGMLVAGVSRLVM